MPPGEQASQDPQASCPLFFVLVFVCVFETLHSSDQEQMTVSPPRTSPCLELEWVWLQPQGVYPGILQEGMSEEVT